MGALFGWTKASSALNHSKNNYISVLKEDKRWREEEEKEADCKMSFVSYYVACWHMPYGSGKWEWVFSFCVFGEREWGVFSG